LEHWNIGIGTYWNIGILEHWSRYWNIGILEHCNIGTFEYSNNIRIVVFGRGEGMRNEY
jgi:hypothetical protein